jgi:hypothetical protein
VVRADQIDPTAAQQLLARLVAHFDRIDRALAAPGDDATVYQRELRVLRDELAACGLVPRKLAVAARVPSVLAIPLDWAEAVRQLDRARVELAVNSYVPTDEALDAFLHSGGPNPWAEYRKLLAAGGPLTRPVQQVAIQPGAAPGGVVDVPAPPET